MFKENQLLRDSKVLYSLSSGIRPLLFSYRGYKIKPETTFRQPLIASSPVGITCFSRELNPGEYFEITIKMPYTPIELSSMEHQQMAHLDFTQMKEKTIEFWENILSMGMQIELPEEKPVHVYKTSLIYDLIARDKIGEHYAQKVNEFHYDAFWLRDSAYFVRSYDLGGYFEIARQCLDFFFNWQKEDGNFLSQGGQYDGWGQTLWALGQHFRLTRDRNFGEKSLKAIMKAAQWLKAEMETDHFGIMPQSTPGDNENIEGGHITGHNFWALAGLKNAILLAEGLEKKEEAAELNSIYKKLNRNFQKALKKVLKKTQNYIPPGLDKEGGQDWGNLMAVYPEEILDPFHPAVTETLKRSKEKYREKIMTYDNTQYLHHYLTMKNTETLIIRGAQEDVLDEFYAILAHTSSTQAGFEFSINPWSNRDFRANLTPHGWFAAKYRNMLRNMLIRERQNTLHLLSVVSPVWVIPGKHIVVKEAPTYFGKVTFTALFKEQGMDLKIKSAFFQPPETIAVHIPYFSSIKTATKGKISKNILYISPHEENVTIVWEKKPNVPGFSFQKTVSWLKEEYKK